MMDPSEKKAALIQGLAGDHLELYHRSAHFYHSINALADMLPTWIEGIAARSEKMDARIQTTMAVVEIHADET